MKSKNYSSLKNLMIAQPNETNLPRFTWSEDSVPNSTGIREVWGPCNISSHHILLRWRVVWAVQPHNTMDRPVLSRPRLLIQYIRSLRPSSEAAAFICSPRTPHVVAIMDPLHLRIKEIAWQECTNRGGLHFVRRCVRFVGPQYETLPITLSEPRPLKCFTRFW